MKKLLLIALMTFAGQFLYGQCTPDTINYSSPGVYPTDPPGLADAYTGQPYTATITFIIPKDTLLGGFTIPVDSSGIVEFKGLPAGFTYTPDRPSGYWYGDSVGCVLISGTPTSTQIGTHNLVIKVRAYGLGLNIDDSVTHLSINVLNGNSIDDNELDGFYLMQNMPNPFSEHTEISYILPERADVQIDVLNMFGELVYSARESGKFGRNSHRLYRGELEAGIYFFKVSYKNHYATRRMIITE